MVAMWSSVIVVRTPKSISRAYSEYPWKAGKMQHVHPSCLMLYTWKWKPIYIRRHGTSILLNRRCPNIRYLNKWKTEAKTLRDINIQSQHVPRRYFQYVIHPLSPLKTIKYDSTMLHPSLSRIQKYCHSWGSTVGVAARLASNPFPIPTSISPTSTSQSSSWWLSESSSNCPVKSRRRSGFRLSSPAHLVSDVTWDESGWCSLASSYSSLTAVYPTFLLCCFVLPSTPFTESVIRPNSPRLDEAFLEGMGDGFLEVGKDGAIEELAERRRCRGLLTREDISDSASSSSSKSESSSPSSFSSPNNLSISSSGTPRVSG